MSKRVRENEQEEKASVREVASSLKRVEFSDVVTEHPIAKVGKKRKLYNAAKLTEPALEITDFKSTAYEVHMLKEKNRKLEYDIGCAKSEIIWLKDTVLKIDGFLAKKFPKIGSTPITEDDL